jgi:hypothetical protein
MENCTLLVKINLTMNIAAGPSGGRHPESTMIGSLNMYDFRTSVDVCRYPKS